MGIAKELSQIDEFIYKGQYEKALLKLKGLENIAGLAAADHLRCQLLKSEILTFLGDYDQAIRIANHSFKESEKLGKPLQKIDSVIRKVFLLIVSRKYGEASALIETGEEILEAITQVSLPEIERRKAELYQFKSRILEADGELIGALEFGQKSLSIREELSVNLEIAFSLQTIGSVYSQRGELDQALEYFQKSKIIGKELGHHFLLSSSYYFIGRTYLSRGDLDQASEYYQKILSMKGTLPLTIKEDTLNSLGIVFVNKGETDQALTHYKKSLAINEATGNKRSIAVNLGNIGEAYIGKGDFNSALDCFKRALSIYREIENDWGLAEVLYVLIREFFDDLPSATTSSYLDEFQEINDRRREIPLITQKFRLAKATALKKSARLTDKMMALSIFQEVAEEEIVWYELTVTAMINLSGLLLFELKTTGDETVLNDVKKLTRKLQAIAESQDSYWLLVETYILQSKLALMELDLEKAQKLLTKADQIAGEKKFVQLTKTISIELVLLSSQFSKWERIIRQNPSIKERIELTQLNTLLERMLHKKYDEQEVYKYAEEARQLVEAWGK